jgi:hypothetical protein
MAKRAIIWHQRTAASSSHLDGDRGAGDGSGLRRRAACRGSVARGDLQVPGRWSDFTPRRGVGACGGRIRFRVRVAPGARVRVGTRRQDRHCDDALGQLVGDRHHVRDRRGRPGARCRSRRRWISWSPRIRATRLGDRWDAPSCGRRPGRDPHRTQSASGSRPLPDTAHVRRVVCARTSGR